ncbi:hypothetical protein [Pararhodobacter zhoushanensis]|uniref:Uncharacterized protein n=1 Tax=Pararhodobacter zhoushanensis TaxID=2479545 RepID=A0ABT3GZ61_9RHOB|nr:hypothetical protein [Pararhodobacter zhoushanensis]MCW1932812.1 hypothetical protein [Pararhodobacter zhoushanensis]
MTRLAILTLFLALPLLASPAAAQRRLCVTSTIGSGPDAWSIRTCYPIDRPHILPRR